MNDFICVLLLENLVAQHLFSSHFLNDFKLFLDFLLSVIASEDGA